VDFKELREIVWKFIGHHPELPFQKNFSEGKIPFSVQEISVIL